MLEFGDGTFLAYWYEQYLAVPALLVAAYLTLKSTFSMPWTRRSALIARALTILGTALVVLIVLDRFGIETLPMDTFDPEVYGYLSVAGAGTAIVVGGIGALMSRGRRGRRRKKKDDAPAAGAAPVEQDLMADLAAAAAEGEPATTMVLNRIGGAMAWLVVRSGGEPGSIIKLTGTSMIVGRDSVSEVHLDHPSVSGSHALIRGEQGAYTLSDLGSSNGTWINGELVAGAILKDGSKIAIGSSELFYTLVAGAEDGLTAQTGVLLVKSGPAMGKSFRVEQGDLLIGRRAGFEGANIDDPAVSSIHAMLRQMPRGARLYDLGSANGTAVDGVALTGAALSDGDVLKFGDAEVQFVQGDSG